MNYYRKNVVAIMQSWIGKKESDGSHKSIIDIYNTIKPIPRGYIAPYTTPWCAITVSAAFHKAGYDAIFPSECSCTQILAMARNRGIWVENDAYIPSPGDCILYDWDDSGKGDNKGEPDHIGMVEKVEGSTITIIEGNYSDSVKRRGIAVNSKYIRGYVVPKFTAYEETVKTPTVKKTTLKFKAGDIVDFTGTTHYVSSSSTKGTACKSGKAKITQVENGSSHPYHCVATSGSKSTVYGWVDADKVKSTSTEVPKEVKASCYAASGPVNSLCGNYKVSVTKGVEIRNGAGTKYKVLATLPKGTIVQNYGYYTAINGVKWLYVQTVYNNVRYVGFVHIGQLTKA